MSDQENELPSIDMTSQADQEFMDADVEPGRFDPVEHYEQTLEYFEEKGWDTSKLEPPEGYEEAESMTDLSELKQQLTPRGKKILEATIERKGEEWVAENKDLILAQARQVGMEE